MLSVKLLEIELIESIHREQADNSFGGMEFNLIELCYKNNNNIVMHGSLGYVMMTE